RRWGRAEGSAYAFRRVRKAKRAHLGAFPLVGTAQKRAFAHPTTNSLFRLSNSHAPSPAFFGRRRVRRSPKCNSALPPRGAERRKTRGRARPPMDSWRSCPVGRFAKASPRSGEG